MLLISSLLCSCSIFKKVDKKSSRSEVDSTRTVEIDRTDIDTSKYSSFTRWGILLPNTTLEGKTDSFHPLFPLVPGYGRSMKELSTAMAELHKHFKKIQPNRSIATSNSGSGIMDTSDYIPVFFETYERGQNGISNSSKETHREEIRKKSDTREVSRVPDYTWILYAVGALAICVFVIAVFRKWSLR